VRRRRGLKTWTVAELKNVVSALTPLVGLRLQEILTSDQDVVLGFYSPEGILWLWIDLNALRPVLLPWSELPLRPQPIKSPLNLFLRAHFRDHALRGADLAADQGRVVILSFGNDRSLELRLFPHGRNILAFSEGKKLAWQKPQPLSETVDQPQAAPPRSLDELRDQWLEARGHRKSSGKKSADPKVRLQHDLEKKRKAHAKVEEELQRKQEQPFKAIGDWLKTHQTLNVPKEWEPFVDKRRKLSWNIEEIYAKARESHAKIAGTEKRLAVLTGEITRLERQLEGPLREMPKVDRKPKVSLSDMEAQGRTLRLTDDLTVVAGKSAADNLKILRKARAWDLWFHLRDYPSSHAVLFRNKNAKVSDAVLVKVADWFLRQTLGAKVAGHAGEKFALVIVECRHVHPVKGDKIGRVTYHDERTLIYKLPGP
jgi:predicted ribosome quality control (RQC) complex YloA/Tae2 family protein